MKKIKINQPFASMIIAGTLQTLPKIWDDIKYGEKIYIYADNLDDCLKKGLYYENELHKKVYNEMVLGNIPDDDEDYYKDYFIGYVFASHPHKTTLSWNGDADNHIFVNNPHKLKYPIQNYETSFAELERLPGPPMKPLRMKRINEFILSVPVGEVTWNKLRNKDEYKDVFLFWEEYMHKDFKTLFESSYDEEIFEVHFTYKNKTMKFETDGETGFNFGKKLIPLFTFDLTHINYESEIDFIEKEFTKKEKRSRWITMISTPMGGMNKYRK